MRRSSAIDQIPRVVGKVGVARVIPVAITRRGPPPTRILPLRLGRESILAVDCYPTGCPLPLRELNAVIRRIRPTHRLHRMAGVDAVVEAVPNTIKEARIATNHCQVFPLGDLILPHPRPPADGHRRLGTLVVPSIYFVR